MSRAVLREMKGVGLGYSLGIVFGSGLDLVF